MADGDASTALSYNTPPLPPLHHSVFEPAAIDVGELSAPHMRSAGGDGPTATKAIAEVPYVAYKTVVRCPGRGDHAAHDLGAQYPVQENASAITVFCPELFDLVTAGLATAAVNKHREASKCYFAQASATNQWAGRIALMAPYYKAARLHEQARLAALPAAGGGRRR